MDALNLYCVSARGHRDLVVANEQWIARAEGTSACVRTSDALPGISGKLESTDDADRHAPGTSHGPGDDIHALRVSYPVVKQNVSADLAVIRSGARFWI